MLLPIIVGCTQAAEAQEIVIGAAWPFAAENSMFNEGIDLAVKEINAAGGVQGKKLKLLKKDDGSEVIKGIAMAESLVENEAVKAVIGHRSSYVTIPAAAIYEQAGLTMLSPASTAPELTRNNYRYVFRNLPGDVEIASRLAERLAEQGTKRLVLYYSKDAYGLGLANAFEDQAASRGITIVDRFTYYSGQEELNRLHERWQAFGFDGIFIAANLAQGAQFIVDASEIGIAGPFAGGNALDAPQFAKLAGKATLIGSMFDPDSDRAEVQRFVKVFRETYGITPTSKAALGYDAVKMLAFALKKAEDLDRGTIADSLRNMGKWLGVCGVHELSESGDDLGDLVVLKECRDGKFVYLEQEPVGQIK
jgi:branched-chain amino acid transport system substrate-binding protein